MAGLTSPIPYTSESRRSLLRLDWGLLGSAMLLLTFGLMSLYSLGQASQGAFLRKQILYVSIGLVPFFAFSLIHPSTWRKASTWIYLLNLVLLIVVLFKGKHLNGSVRWLLLPGGTQFQPSEFAKLATILTLSAYYSNRQDAIHRLGTFFGGFLHVALPMALILEQPHLGAMLVILVMWLAISVIAGVPSKFIGTSVVCLAIGGFALSVPSVRGKLLHGYQDKRVNGLLKSSQDRKGMNWQVDRAEIAFGAGGVSGTGFGRGEQKAAKFIPEQNNDFILTVIGEEGGLVGCTLLLATFGFFFYRIFVIMLNASDVNYKMVCAGVFAVLGFHTFVNMAMVLHLVPVVGLWLPFMSSGGTAIWLCMSCVGLLIGIRRRQRPLLFS